MAKAMIDALRKVIRRMHYPLEVMLTCVRWYPTKIIVLSSGSFGRCWDSRFSVVLASSLTVLRRCT
jgi:hypothetical protein